MLPVSCNMGNRLFILYFMLSPKLQLIVYGFIYVVTDVTKYDMQMVNLNELSPSDKEKALAYLRILNISASLYTSLRARPVADFVASSVVDRATLYKAKCWSFVGSENAFNRASLKNWSRGLGHVASPAVQKSSQVAASTVIPIAGHGSELHKEGAGISGAVQPMHGDFYGEAPVIITAEADEGVASRAEVISPSQGSLTHAEDQLASLLYDNDVGSQMGTQATSVVDDETHDSGIGSHVIDVGIKVIHDAPDKSNHVADVAIPTDFKTASEKRVMFSLVNTKNRGNSSSSMVKPLHAMPPMQRLALVPSFSPEPQSSCQSNDVGPIDVRDDGLRGGGYIPSMDAIVSEDALVTASLERDSEDAEAAKAVEDLLQHVLSQTNNTHDHRLESSPKPPTVVDMAAKEELCEGLNMQGKSSLHEDIPILPNDAPETPPETFKKHVSFSSSSDSAYLEDDCPPPAKIWRGHRSTRSKKAAPIRRSARTKGSGTSENTRRSKRR